MINFTCYPISSIFLCTMTFPCVQLYSKWHYVNLFRMVLSKQISQRILCNVQNKLAALKRDEDALLKERDRLWQAKITYARYGFLSFFFVVLKISDIK
jgi:hypothetical protein